MTYRNALGLTLAAVLALGSAATAAPRADAPAADAPSAGGPTTPDARTQKAFKQALNTTQRRIQASPAESRAMAEAVYKKDEKGMQRILVRNGFPEALLRDVKIGGQTNGPYDAGARKIKVKIEGGCCPWWVVITIGQK